MKWTKWRVIGAALVALVLVIAGYLLVTRIVHRAPSMSSVIQGEIQLEKQRGEDASKQFAEQMKGKDQELRDVRDRLATANERLVAARGERTKPWQTPRDAAEVAERFKARGF
jgi:hypothetical protein